MKLLFSCASFICRVIQKGPSLMLKLSCYVALIYIATYWTPFLRRAYEIAVVVLSAWPSLCLSVCPCACLSICQFGIFLSNGLLLFSHFWRDGKQLEYLKCQPFFPGKFIFSPNLGKKDQKWPLDFLKNFVNFSFKFCCSYFTTHPISAKILALELWAKCC